MEIPKPPILRHLRSLLGRTARRVVGDPYKLRPEELLLSVGYNSPQATEAALSAIAPDIVEPDLSHLEHTQAIEQRLQSDHETFSTDLQAYLLTCYLTRLENRESLNRLSDVVVDQVEPDDIQSLASVKLQTMRETEAPLAHLLTIDLPPFADLDYESFVKQRDDINRAIIAAGGTVLPQDDRVRYKPRHSSVIFTNEDDTTNPCGILFTQKKRIATLPDGTWVIERTSFVLRLDDESAFPREYVEAMKQISFSSDGTWQEKVLDTSHVEEVFARPEAFDAEVWRPRHMAIVPVAKTLYAYNRSSDEARR